MSRQASRFTMDRSALSIRRMRSLSMGCYCQRTMSSIGQETDFRRADYLADFHVRRAAHLQPCDNLVMRPQFIPQRRQPRGGEMFCLYLEVYRPLGRSGPAAQQSERGHYPEAPIVANGVTQWGILPFGRALRNSSRPAQIKSLQCLPRGARR
jgi:hypothetical protein